MNDCASAGENQIRGCSLSRAIVAITPQHSQHLIIFVKKSVAIPSGIKKGYEAFVFSCINFDFSI
ncbi:hypothetical protein, partial [Enterococcus faecium]|uniref:hypothetical protein n=1 Tax=Enterococcus faecium TaxID=1352 RepID=UPI0020282758